MMENSNPWFIEGSSKARLVSHTPDPEAMMGYIARVTSKDQTNPNIKGLLKYCAKHGHWSVFEQASMTVEVVTPLAIAVQLLRHRSFCFQQFSGRYEDQQFMKNYTGDLSAHFNLFYVPEEARVQDEKNRQNSIPTTEGSLTDAMWNTMATTYTVALHAYEDLLKRGIAKEIARFVLPQGVYSRVYVTGSCRSWIHYIGVRDDIGVAQYEHVELARACKQVFAGVFPTVYNSLDWSYNTEVNETDRLKKEVIELQAEIATIKAMKNDRTSTSD
jgi:thymidylate synthase (FAD)